MKYKKILILLLTSLSKSFLPAAQEPKIQDEPFVIVPLEQHIDQIIKKFPGINQTFAFLQEQDLVHQSFRQFLQTELASDEDESDKCIFFNTKRNANFGEVLRQADEIITANMRDRFIEDLKSKINGNQNATGSYYGLHPHHPPHEKYNSILWYVITHKDYYMKSMIREWVNPWIQNKDISKVVLHMTIMNYCIKEIICMLIDAGANVDSKDRLDKTPLHYAIKRNKLEIVQILIDAGANLNPQDYRGNTPLHYAASSRHTPDRNNVEIMRILINAGADFTAQNKDGDTPLHTAISFRQRYDHADEEAVRLLIDANSNVNQQDNNGDTPLHRAISARSTFYPVKEKVIRMLIDANSNVNIQNKNGDTPLHTATSTDLFNRVDAKIVRMLIDASANVNLKNNYGNTPLHFAAHNHGETIDLGIVCALINTGADLTIQNARGNTAQQVANTLEMRIIFMRAQIQEALSCTIS